MKYKEPANCNRCKTKNCKGMWNPERTCQKYVNPGGTWMLAELVLAYPTSLNEALSALPFECDLNFYLK